MRDADRLPSLHDALQTLRRRLPGAPPARGAAALLVGGALRDSQLGRPFSDVDLVVPGDAEAYARTSAEELHSRLVVLDERRGVYRVPLRDGVLDIVRMQGTLREDLGRRDFTIDALALPLADLPDAGLPALARSMLIDPLGGLRDLDAGLVRVTAPRALDDDPLRLLRAVRLATELQFELEGATRAAISERAPALVAVAPERIGQELLRLFRAEGAARGVRLLEAVDLLRHCFPDLDAGRGLAQRPHHRYAVFEHQLVACDWLDVLLAADPPEHDGAPPGAAEIWRRTGHAEAAADGRWLEVRQGLGEDAAALRLATLLHDIAKPATLQLDPAGNTRFFGHAELGAKMARDALARWRLPHRVSDRVALLIEHHLRPGQIAAPGQRPTARALHRFHGALGDAVAEICVLFLADSLATAGPERLIPRWPAYVEHVRRIIAWEPAAPARRLARLIDGHAVMRITGLPPGPRVGRILQAVEEAVVAGEASDREAAERLIATLGAELAREPEEHRA